MRCHLPSPHPKASEEDPDLEEVGCDPSLLGPPAPEEELSVLELVPSELILEPFQPQRASLNVPIYTSVCRRQLPNVVWNNIVTDEGRPGQARLGSKWKGDIGCQINNQVWSGSLAKGFRHTGASLGLRPFSDVARVVLLSCWFKKTTTTNHRD